MTYDELKTKIRDYTEVSSTVLTDIIVNGIIEDAEFRILRDGSPASVYISPKTYYPEI